MSRKYWIYVEKVIWGKQLRNTCRSIVFQIVIILSYHFYTFSVNINPLNSKIKFHLDSGLQVGCWSNLFVQVEIPFLHITPLAHQVQLWCYMQTAWIRIRRQVTWCLTRIQAICSSDNNFPNFERHWSTLKIQADDNLADNSLFGGLRVKGLWW